MTAKKILRGSLIVLMIPLYIVLKLLRWAGTLIQMLSAWVFRLLGIIFLLTTLGCYYFQLEDTQSLMRMAISGLAVFMLPAIGDAAVTIVALLEESLRLRIRYGLPEK